MRIPRRGGAGALRHPWRVCTTCKVAFTGPLRLALAREWCRRTAQLPPKHTQHFAARTTLGNALAAAGELAEAAEVVARNLDSAAALVADAVLKRSPPNTLVAGGRASEFRRIGRWMPRGLWARKISKRLGLNLLSGSGTKGEGKVLKVF